MRRLKKENNNKEINRKHKIKPKNKQKIEKEHQKQNNLKSRNQKLKLNEKHAQPLKNRTFNLRENKGLNSNYRNITTE